MYQLAIDELGGTSLVPLRDFKLCTIGPPLPAQRAVLVRRFLFVPPGRAGPSHLNGRRETNHRSTTTYMRRVLAGRVAEFCRVRDTVARRAGSRNVPIFPVARCFEGVKYEEFASRHAGFRIDDLAGDAIRNFLQLFGFLEVVDESNSAHARRTDDQRFSLARSAIGPSSCINRE